MTIQDLEQLINKLAQSSGIAKNDIIESLAQTAEIKFSDMNTSKRHLVDYVKGRIVRKCQTLPNFLYTAPSGAVIVVKQALQKNFNLNESQYSVFGKALQELENEGLIEIEGGDTIKLTPKGQIL